MKMNNSGHPTPDTINHTMGVVDDRSQTAVNSECGKENTHRKTRRRKSKTVRRVVNNIIYGNGIFNENDFTDMDLSTVVSEEDMEDCVMERETSHDVIEPHKIVGIDQNITDYKPVEVVKSPDDQEVLDATGFNNVSEQSYVKAEQHTSPENAISVKCNAVPVTTDEVKQYQTGLFNTEHLNQKDNGTKHGKDILDTNGNIYSCSNEMNVDFSAEQRKVINNKQEMDVDTQYNYVFDIADKALDLSTKKSVATPDSIHDGDIHDCDIPGPSSNESSTSSLENLPPQTQNGRVNGSKYMYTTKTHHSDTDLSLVSYRSLIKSHTKSKHGGSHLSDQWTHDRMKLAGNNFFQTLSPENHMLKYGAFMESIRGQVGCDSTINGQYNGCEREDMNGSKHFSIPKPDFFNIPPALQHIPPSLQHIPPSLQHIPNMLLKNHDEATSINEQNASSDQNKQPVSTAFLSPKLHTCKICFATFNLRKDLIAHIRTHPFKKHECSVCHRFFNEIGNLRQHMRVHDADDVPHECPTCHRKFRHKSTLNNHIRTHTDERPYKCPVCNKGFKIANGLTSHMRKHTGETPYNCDSCDKTFKNFSNLQQHQFQHTGIRKFECHICLGKYSRKSILDNHMKKIHNYPEEGNEELQNI